MTSSLPKASHKVLCCNTLVGLPVPLGSGMLFALLLEGRAPLLV